MQSYKCESTGTEYAQHVDSYLLIWTLSYNDYLYFINNKHLTVSLYLEISRIVISIGTPLPPGEHLLMPGGMFGHHTEEMLLECGG